MGKTINDEDGSWHNFGLCVCENGNEPFGSINCWEVLQ
jgi:hypothetical protein